MIFDVLGIVSKFIPDKTKAMKLETEIKKAHAKSLDSAVKSDTTLRLAEMKSKGLSSVWRPLSAISIFMCLFLYWFVYPLCMIIVGLFDLNVYLPQLPELPLEFYGLATAFVSIYAFGRSMDKRT